MCGHSQLACRTQARLACKQHCQHMQQCTRMWKPLQHPLFGIAVSTNERHPAHSLANYLEQFCQCQMLRKRSYLLLPGSAELMNLIRHALNRCMQCGKAFEPASRQPTGHARCASLREQQAAATTHSATFCQTDSCQGAGYHIKQRPEAAKEQHQLIHQVGHMCSCMAVCIAFLQGLCELNVMHKP